MSWQRAGSVFVLEGGGWEAGLHLVDCSQHLFREAGCAAALPREPSGGRKRQDTYLNKTFF